MFENVTSGTSATTIGTEVTPGLSRAVGGLVRFYQPSARMIYQMTDCILTACGRRAPHGLLRVQRTGGGGTLTALNRMSAVSDNVIRMLSSIVAL